MRTLITVAAALLALTATSSSFAQDAGFAIKSYQIPAQSMSAALKAFAAQSEMQLIYTESDVGAATTAGVKGDLPPRDALDRMLQGSNLEYEITANNVIVIRKLLAAKPTANSTTADTAQWKLARTESVRGASESGQSQTPDADAKSAPRAIEEVVVTATKRAESAQDIPLSIAVISGQEVERRGVIGMEDYLRSIPGVNQIDSGASNNSIVIRGITTSPQSENFASGPAAATYFGETSITGAGGVGAAGIDVRPVDIERIEVLRGPQGTTYGSASLSGTVRIVPASPKLDRFGARFAAAYSDTSRDGSANGMIQAVLNIPVVTDKFAVRAVGYRYDESGFYRNVAGVDPVSVARAQSWGIGSFLSGYVRDDVGQMVTTGGRLAALLKATDRLNLSATVLTQKIEQDGRPEATLSEFGQARFPIVPAARSRGAQGEIADTEMTLANLVLNYDLSWADLTSAVSHIDASSGVVLDLTPTFGFPISTNTPSDFESFSVETRIASKLAGPLQFLGGLYYENIDELQTQRALAYGPPAPNPYGYDPVGTTLRTRDLDQRAVFGELSYDLTSQLTAIAGARYFKYDKSESTLREGSIYRTPIGTGVAAVRQRKEDHAVYKGVLNFKPTGESLLYASWSQGFRLGRPQAGLPAAACDTNNDGLVDGSSTTIRSTQEIGSDFLDNYELGGKFALFDRRVVIDTSIYHIKWDGLPSFFVASCNLGYTTNAGTATSDGAEFQASVYAAQGLRIDFGGGYTRAELAESVPGLGVKGARLPGSPKLNANLSAQYEFAIAGHEAFVRADSFYTGGFYGDLLQSPLTQAGEYFKVDARAGIAIGSASIELFVRNLTNEDAFTWRGLTNSNSFAGFRLRPRTLGIQVSYSLD